MRLESQIIADGLLVHVRFRTAGYAAIDSICDYYESLRERPVNAQVQPGFLAKSVPGEGCGG